MRIAVKFCFSMVMVITAGCTQLAPGFIELAGGKDRQVQETYGQGKYYRFVVSGSEIRKTYLENYKQYGKGYPANTVSILVPKYMEQNQVCTNGYEIISDSLIYYEGGTASIYVRCK